MHVMADEHQRALVAHERLSEAFDAVNVQMRRWLVHEQQVGRIDEELHQVQAALLAAGKHAALLVHLLLAEQEAAQNRAGIIFA